MIAPPEGRLEWLAAIARDRAHMVGTGALDLHDAVDGLQYLAERWGLVDVVGQDEIQHVIAAPFRLPQVEEAA